MQMVGVEAATLDSETNMVEVKEQVYGKGLAHCGFLCSDWSWPWHSSQNR